MASKTGIAASNDVNSSSDVGRDCGSNSERLKCVSDIFWGAARGEYIITSPNQCKFYDSVALKCAYKHTYTHVCTDIHTFDLYICACLPALEVFPRSFSLCFFKLLTIRSNAFAFAQPQRQRLCLFRFCCCYLFTHYAYIHVR